MKTRSDIPLEASYSAPDGSGENPGEFPFTRGRKPNPHSGSWIQRELSGEGDARRSNEQIRYLLEHGQNGIDFIGDAATQSMLDPDHPLTRASVGTQGASLCRKQDYLELFEGVSFDGISVSTSVPAPFALAGLTLAAREKDFPLDQLRGSVLQPPLYMEDCAYAWHVPVEVRIRMALDSIEYCTRHMPRYYGYLEDTYFFAESGLTPVEEIALGFIQLRLIVRRMIERGVDVDSFAPRIAMLVDCGMDFYEEVAKIRATRRLYAKMMRDEFSAKNDRSQSLTITSHTSGLSLTAQQPANNIVRGTMQALSLIMGGVQALEISAFDEAFRTPSKEAHLLGLRTQQIADLESGVARVADPFGGSYFMEQLTDEMESRIRSRIDEIEVLGDAEELCRQGFFRDIFHRAMEDSHRLVENGELPIVGVNVHQLAEEDDTLLRDVASGKIDPVHEHTERVEKFRQSRDISKTCEGLARIKQAMQSSDNLVEAIVSAMDADATVGEIVTVIRRSVGIESDPFDQPLPEEM
ncbi:MAG: hypothetical protein HOC70_11085 [Gammaproteobacteria bacterium]|jgi:methylmalonyl-CoA mutase, N-terminal domain|nr:hypothetical protein [Gammaproteobacteria bacterium]